MDKYASMFLHKRGYSVYYPSNLATRVEKMFTNSYLPQQLNYTVKFPQSSILHCAFSSQIEKAMTKTIYCHRENRFVLQ